MHENNLDQAHALAFILGGNALFTVQSLKTNTRFTIKVLGDRKREGFFKVSWMNGKDNTRDYKMIGEIETENGMAMFKGYSRTEPVTIAFDHIFMNLSIGLFMPSLEIWHNGRCCKCGRILTVPESIKNGIGPECIKQNQSYEEFL